MCICEVLEVLEACCGENRREGGREEERTGVPGVARKCSIVLQLSGSAEDFGGGKRVFLSLSAEECRLIAVVVVESSMFVCGAQIEMHI